MSDFEFVSISFHSSVKVGAMFPKIFMHFYLFFFPSILSKFNTSKPFDQSKELLICITWEQMFCSLISYPTYSLYAIFRRGERETFSHRPRHPETNQLFRLAILFTLLRKLVFHIFNLQSSDREKIIRIFMWHHSTVFKALWRT